MTFTAAVVANVVKDVEQIDDTLVGSVRPDGLTRVECPDYVQVGWRKSGANWLMPDGSTPPADVVRRYILPADFFGKLSDASLQAICTAAQTQPAVMAALFRIASAPYLASDDPLLQTAYTWLKSNAILSAADKKALFLAWRRTPPVEVKAES